jgi:HD-GYP domain-containing protein (c-di-GMP phosphodiesterase class II)
VIESVAPSPGSSERGAVLLVDNEAGVLLGLGRLVRRLGYRTVSVTDAAQALTLLSLRPFDAIVSDLNLRMLSGGVFAAYVAALVPEVPLIIITGTDSLHQISNTLGATRVDAIIPKSRCADELPHVLERAIGRGRTSARGDQTARLMADGLVRALALRDVETEGHSRRVAAWTLALARRLGTPKGDWLHVELGGLLHDVGKIGVPDSILRKPGKLTEAEWDEMRRHPELGCIIIGGIPALTMVADIIRSHHERWDGKGYPDRLAREDIPEHARTFALVDTYDALTSDRPYRSGRSHEEAVDVIRAASGSQFEPRVVDAFLDVPAEEWLSVARMFSDHCRVAAPSSPGSQRLGGGVDDEIHVLEQDGVPGV